jgi:hypothetical protein
MSILGFWLFLAWMGLVVAVGITFLVWAWRHVGPSIMQRVQGRQGVDPKLDREPEKRVLRCRADPFGHRT